jgi:TRAP-type mannitol/chloroaromatic compound transport system substrate-binding protein
MLLLAALVAVSALFVVEKAEQQTGQIQQVNNATRQHAVYQWRLVTSWPKNFPGLGEAPEEFADLVEKMSDGRLKIKVHGAGELVPALGVFDAVSQGSAEMGHSAAYYWKGKSPAMPFFTTVPFGLTVQEMNGWLYYGGGMELWRELYEPFNLVPMAGGNTGVQMAGWFNKEINSLEDLKGLKMRMPGLGGEVLNRIGGTAVGVPGGEIYTSLQTGVIDATEWVGPYNDKALGLHEVARYYYYPGWHEPGSSLEFIVNKQALASLPDDLQAIVETAARAINQDMLDKYTARNNAALQSLLVDQKVQLRRFPDEVLKRFYEISEEVLKDLVANDEFANRVYQSWRAYRDDVREYYRISEQAYINARDP